jgi:hypothetical protein
MTLDHLKAKLAAREGQPGFRRNADELRAMIDRLEGAGFVYKSAINGAFVTADFADANPHTTYKTRAR